MKEPTNIKNSATKAQFVKHTGFESAPAFKNINSERKKMKHIFLTLIWYCVGRPKHNKIIFLWILQPVEVMLNQVKSDFIYVAQHHKSQICLTGLYSLYHRHNTSDIVSIRQTKLAIWLNSCLALSPYTCYQIYLMFFSCEHPLHPTDTLWCSYIPGSYFSIYTHWDEQWAPGSPHSPTWTQVDTDSNTETHFLPHTHTHTHAVS